jgi:hypothetical protein
LALQMQPIAVLFSCTAIDNDLCVQRNSLRISRSKREAGA